MKVGFIGFGGAAYGLAKGLAEAGLKDMSYYDSLMNVAPNSEVIAKRAEETGATSKDSIEKLLQEADLIISCVTGSVALKVARQAAENLTPQHVYVDVNTSSPGTMEEVYAAIKKSGATFADVAMLGAIPAFLHRVPCLASGSGAERFKAAMQPYDMDITCVGQSPGQASAIKMFRSIFMKGFLALLMEMLSATHRYQVDSVVLESIGKTMEKNTFLETVRLQMAKGVISAERMSHEMEAVVETLDEMGLPSVMASATKDKLGWCAQMGLADHFGHEMVDSLNVILDAMDERNQ